MNKYPELKMFIEQGYAVCGAFVIDNPNELRDADRLHNILAQDPERPSMAMNIKGNTIKVILRYPPEDRSDPGDLDLRGHYKNVLDGGEESAVKGTRKDADKALTAPEMNEAYFSNPEYVRADLEAFLAQAEVDTLADLNTRNPKPGTSIIAQNGQPVRWQAYLDRASAALFGTQYQTVHTHRKADALNKLLDICGVIHMNEAYFRNPKYVRADLEAFLDQAKGDQLVDLNTNNPKYSTSIVAQTGQTVAWNVYLNRAFAALFGVTQGTDAAQCKADALEELLEICGVEPE